MVPYTFIENDRVTADILRLQLEQSLEEDRHKFYQWDVDQMGGPQAEPHGRGESARQEAHTCQYMRA